MSVLCGIEHRIESLVEGVFGRAFRSNVQPVELARKLAKEMDEHKTISVSRVYVPNEYALYLSPDDRKQFREYEESLLTELGDYLAEHARREGYALLSTPSVKLEEDEDLGVGEFGIATRMVQPRRAGDLPPSADEVDLAAKAPDVVPAAGPGATKIFKPPVETAAVTPEEADELGLARDHAALVIDGHRHELTKRRVVLGRSRDCDITLGDPNVSRRHAEVRLDDGGYEIVDLNSTNGIEVNGRRVDRARLAEGDVIVLGETELRFERSS
ncbi:MAG: DUF2662 domain-containing protein [Actinobacteria bacterium]|nr:MAG: DUF2662 domain-containing protein [Actinomycetota bacterium]